MVVAHQAPLPMGFSRQEHWSGLPSPHPGDLPDSGIEPRSLRSPAPAGGLYHQRHPGSPAIMKISKNLKCYATSLQQVLSETELL